MTKKAAELLAALSFLEIYEFAFSSLGALNFVFLADKD
jgi:hypothetical protein